MLSNGPYATSKCARRVEGFRLVRFAKREVLECFDRQDRSYRLALLCTYWIRDTARYKPNASEEAKGFRMKVCGTWLSFADLADMLEQQSSREALSSDFLLNQLHALIRAPFEILRDYCEDYDKTNSTRSLLEKMKETSWYEVARIVRNTISHNLRVQYKKTEPTRWNGITISQEMDGKTITSESLWHKSGYELFLEMRRFAEALPE